MNLAGDSNNISSCLIEAGDNNIINTTYNSSGEKKKKITYDAKDYEPGLPSQLDFSCTSNIVKANFSCETLKIVEKHLYELKANNFYDVINSHGGFANYTKSVGEIFGEYYGKEMSHETSADFQRATEYVIGWMYMYGWTYWGSPNVFWKNGFYENYDNGKNPDKLNEKTWNFGNVRHNAIVGEVYSDHLVIYDVGSYFPKHQNYKRVIYFPNEASGETDMDAIRKEYTYYGKNVDWGMRRWYDFKDN